jgi:hypothetical protein
VRRNPWLRTEIGQRCARVAVNLAVPFPFDIDAFRARLEQVTGRETHLRAVRMPVGVGSGIRLSSNGADYFYYEERTSPFHQAHIVVGLGAQMLLASPGPVIDARLTQGLEPQLVRHFLGEDARVDGGEAEADLCAYLALEGLHPIVSRRAARRLLADLTPLPHVLAAAVPGAATGLRPGGRVPAGLRLYQVVTGILDLMLAFGLVPSSDAVSATLAGEAARLASMPRELDQFVLRRDIPSKTQVTDPDDAEPFAGR